MTLPVIAPPAPDESTADFTVRLCPVHGEYDQRSYDPDQSCPRNFCELVGEEL